MTQKELIDYCNTREKFDVCVTCEHILECKKYIVKYDYFPYRDNEFFPERYTDEEI